MDFPESDVEVRIPVARSVLAVVTGRCYLLQHVHALDDGCPGRVIGRQRGVLPYEEELAAVRVRPGVGHRDRSGGISGAGQVLVIERVARPACSGSCGVTALQDVDALRS